MVKISSARRDLKNRVFLKTITYHKHTNTVKNQMYGNLTTSTTDYEVKCKITVQTYTDRLVKQGELHSGDAIAVLPYQFDKYANGNAIPSPITLAIDDNITYSSNKYKIRELHRIDNEYGDVICYEAKLVRIE